MNTNEIGSSKKNNQKQGTKSEDASSSSPNDSSSHSKHDFNNKTQETEMGTMSDSDDSADLEYLQNQLPFSGRFFSQFDDMMKVVNYCSNKEYRHPLVAPVLCLRFLLQHGIDINDCRFDGSCFNDVVGLLEMMSAFDDNINDDVIKNAPLIQVDLINSCAEETTKSIVEDIGGDYFAILVDKYEDSIALCLRYVDKTGDVIERFVGIANVIDVASSSLKNAICSLLEKHSLNSLNIRGQGYNDLNNMYGDFNGLQTLIKKENQSAYYSHCFTNHLQLTLVERSKETVECVAEFFFTLEDLFRAVILCWKLNEVPKETRFQKVSQALEDSVLEMGNCVIPKLDLEQFKKDKTCWGPYYKMVSNVVEFYHVMVEMLDEIWDEPPRSIRSRMNNSSFLSRDRRFTFENFDFILVAHLMKTVLEVTDELSVVLHKKDEKIVYAMSLVKSIKERLQKIRDEGWETLISSVILFCNQNDIKIPNMEEMYITSFRRKGEPPSTTTNLHHYQVDVFSAIVDLHLQEINRRFDEVNMEILVGMGSLSPIDSFCSFDKQKLIKLASFYPNEFSSTDLDHLNDQLDNYIHDVKKDERFMGLKDIKELSMKLVKVKKHEVYNLVYLLIKLMLILPVATASVERAFSAMDFVRKELLIKESNELLNDRLVTCLEKGVLATISNDDIINNFQSKKNRQEQTNV